MSVELGHLESRPVTVLPVTRRYVTFDLCGNMWTAHGGETVRTTSVFAKRLYYVLKIGTAIAVEYVPDSAFPGIAI